MDNISRRQGTNIHGTKFVAIRFLLDYWAVLKSGLFMHAAYAQRYFGWKHAAWLSLAHYLLRGERNDCQPNPFFNPAFFEKLTGTRRLANYLRHPSLWRVPTCIYFDSAWYLDKYMSAGENPLQHFWRMGFDAGLDCSSRFCTEFFKRAIAQDDMDKKWAAFDFLSDSDYKMPQNSTELEYIQRKFYDKIEFETLKCTNAPAKSTLVFVQVGADSVPPFVTGETPFDVLINFYDAGRPVEAADYVFRQRGTKTTAIRKLLELRPEIFAAYEATLFLDDDVDISSEDISRLFRARTEHGLDLLQASLSEDSSCFYPILKQPFAGRGLRPVTGVEIMMPVISRRAIQECGWIFGEGVSGWGIDILLSAEVRRRYGNSIALLGDVVAVHRRPTETTNNTYYKFLAAHGIIATAEVGRIALKYGADDRSVWLTFCDPAADINSASSAI